MGAAFEAQEDLSLDTEERIDVFDAIVASGVKLHFRPLDGAGLYLPASIAVRPGVLINSQHPLALQRYTGGHELGHHVFGHGEQIDQDGEPRGSGASLPPHEMLAEAFASWFLMPPEAVAAASRRAGFEAPSTPAHAYAIALRLGTSFRATCNRVPELARWRDATVKDVKLELTDIAPTGGWRHDVWLLSDADTEVPVVARCGDTLLFDLATWDVEAVSDGLVIDTVEGRDLLTPNRWRVDIPPDMLAGPAHLSFRQPGSSLNFELKLEGRRVGRYVSAGTSVRP